MVIGQRDDPVRPSRVFGLQQNSPAQVILITQGDVDGSTNKAANTVHYTPRVCIFWLLGEKCEIIFSECVCMSVCVCICVCIKKTISLVEL